MDTTFIETLIDASYKCITHKGYATFNDIAAVLHKVSATELKAEHIQRILKTLIFDGKVEEVEDPRTPTFLGVVGKIYKVSKLEVTKDGHTSTPCGVCPVFSQCTEDGEISPLNCTYLKHWLDF